MHDDIPLHHFAPHNDEAFAAVPSPQKKRVAAPVKMEKEMLLVAAPLAIFPVVTACLAVFVFVLS